MLYFLSGLTAGGVVGYVTCSLLCINRLAKQQHITRVHPYDRRGGHLAQFPLTDCDGALVLADRRIQSDRRLHNSRVMGVGS